MGYRWGYMIYIYRYPMYIPYIYISIRLESLSHNLWGDRTGKFISWDIYIYEINLPVFPVMGYNRYNIQLEYTPSERFPVGRWVSVFFFFVEAQQSQ